MLWADEDVRTAQNNLIDHTEVRRLLVNGEAKSALKASKRLVEDLQCLQRVPISEELATIWIDRGYGHHLLGEDEDVQLAWEQAFSMNRDIQFDEHLFEGLSEDAQEDLLNRFEQIRGLVDAQGIVDPSLPDVDAKVFIDGRLFESGQGVKIGYHVAQIVCPVDGLQSQWTYFEKPLDWVEMCPSGFPEPTESSEEDFFSVGLFAASEDTSQYHNPEPICSSSGFSLSLPSMNFSDDRGVSYTLSAGAGLTLAGAVSYYAWVVPLFNEVRDAQERAEAGNLSTKEAQEVTSSFNVARYSTLGLLVSGTTVTGYGAVLALRTVSVHPIWIPNGIGIAGQF